MVVTSRSVLAAALVLTGAFELRPATGGDPSIIHVAADGSGDYRTIQEAVDHAAAGAIVRIGNGIWNEAVTVTQPLTLEGAGWEVTRIISASAGRRQASPELAESLERISRELDAQTQSKLREAYLKVFGSLPALTVKDTQQVSVRNLSLLRSQPVRKGSFTSDAALDILDASVRLEDCAILESPGVGLAAKGDSQVQAVRCLIANSWGNGVMVAVSEKGSFAIADSEIRNNCYAGLSLGGPSRSISVKRCRIHGTGWHGIRYDDCSPTIEGNVFHKTAVSGIYASGRTGATVKNNLFYHSGISCWFQNADTIESNTFIGDREAVEKGGITQGMQVLGASHPTIRRNLFVTCQNAVFMGDIGSPGPFSKSTGEITLLENAFWHSERNLAQSDVANQEGRGVPLPPGNVEQEPAFIDAERGNFGLDEESPLVKDGIGARHFVLLESPWPAQPEEERSIEAIAERLAQTAGQRR